MTKGREGGWIEIRILKFFVSRHEIEKVAIIFEYSKIMCFKLIFYLILNMYNNIQHLEHLDAISPWYQGLVFHCQWLSWLERWLSFTYHILQVWVQFLARHVYLSYNALGVSEISSYYYAMGDCSKKLWKFDVNSKKFGIRKGI